MYLDALSFLEDERDAWRPYEALVELSDDDLVRPVADARGWSGRDLIVHMIAWQLVALDVAKELAVSPESLTKVQADADWEARGGDVVNAEIEAKWADRPIDEIRDEFLRISGELRGFLTVVPETRWLKNADYQRFFIDETLDHYEDHRPDLAAILSAAGR
jgi:Mycothiol maleylpyruvate isomerase N-terminal domain